MKLKRAQLGMVTEFLIIIAL